MRFEVQPRAYIYMAIILLIFPFKWLTAWMIAVIFHEYCHYIAIKLLGGNCYIITLDIGRANIQCSTLSHTKKLVALAAGPVGGLLPVLLRKIFPRLAICCWLLSVYNLLPILPLDGGQLLYGVAKNSKVAALVEKIVLFLFLILCAMASIFYRLGFLPIVLGGILWLKNRNSPCKETACKVQ